MHAHECELTLIYLRKAKRQLAGELLKQAAQDLERHGAPTIIERELTSPMSNLSRRSTAMCTNFDVSSIALRFGIGGRAMKCNINVIKSVWRRVRKPSRATLDAVYSKNAVYTEVFSETDIWAERADLTMVANLSKAGWGWLCRSPEFSPVNFLRLVTHMATKNVPLSVGRI